MSKAVRIIEVGLRDGLQNESTVISVAHKVELAKKLVSAGLKDLELGAFVRADRIPQMADSDKVIQLAYAEIKNSNVKFSALVPNSRGLEQALQTPIKEVAFFTACSESFAKANINCTIDESLERLAEIMPIAKKNKMRVRGYISTVFGCPYEGSISASRAIKIIKQMIDLGCYEVSVGDTIGVGTPYQVRDFLKKLKKKVPLKKIAGHFHDTRGTALANILVSYETGLRSFDSSIGGLGGCPYAPGASGNVATEDVVYMFDGMGLKTGVDLSQLIATNHWLTGVMGKALPSKTGKASLPKASGKLV